jgi:hypothetical protein
VLGARLRRDDTDCTSQRSNPFCRGLSVVSVRPITQATCICESSRAGLIFALVFGERSRTSGASSLRLHRVSSHRRTRPTSCFSHLPRSSDELTPSTVYVAGSLSPICFSLSPKQNRQETADASSLGDCSSFAWQRGRHHLICIGSL